MKYSTTDDDLCRSLRGEAMALSGILAADFGCRTMPERSYLLSDPGLIYGGKVDESKLTTDAVWKRLKSARKDRRKVERRPSFMVEDSE